MSAAEQHQFVKVLRSATFQAPHGFLDFDPVPCSVTNRRIHVCKERARADPAFLAEPDHCPRQLSCLLERRHERRSPEFHIQYQRVNPSASFFDRIDATIKGIEGTVPVTSRKA